MFKTVYAKVMAKAEFLAFAKDLLGGSARLGYKDPNTGLRVSDFTGWRDWFSYGEWDRGPMTIRVPLDMLDAEEFKTACEYLEGFGFKREEP